MHSSQFGITFTDSRGPVNSDGPIHCIRSLNRMVRYSVMPVCDSIFPLHPELWLTSRGSVPTRHWFISRLRAFFPKNISGHSLRSGGATSLAEGGADLDTIQAVGRWSSNAFRIYIRKNPVVIHAILLGRPA